jgi:multidrug efflux pump subunit AcrB
MNIMNSMNILKKNWNIVVIGYILFFGCIICFSFLSTQMPQMQSSSSFIETMSLADAANADSAKTDMLAAKVNAFQPMFDNVTNAIGDNTTNIKTSVDTITTIVKQRVNNVNKKVGKDITDKNNAPPPVTGLS